MLARQHSAAEDHGHGWRLAGGLRRRTLLIWIARRHRSTSRARRFGPPRCTSAACNLPDGSVLELGGGSANKIENASQEVSLLKSPTSTSWTAMSPLPKGEHRLYHSMAYLADDGSVITLSSNPKGQARSDTVLRFKPPYMFKSFTANHRRCAGDDHVRADLLDQCQQRCHTCGDDDRPLAHAQVSTLISARCHWSTPTARSRSTPRAAWRHGATTGSSRSTTMVQSPSPSGPS